VFHHPDPRPPAPSRPGTRDAVRTVAFAGPCHERPRGDGQDPQVRHGRGRLVREPPGRHRRPLRWALPGHDLPGHGRTASRRRASL